VQFIPDSVSPKWRERKSFAGVYGRSGEDNVFSFEFTITAFAQDVRFCCKGYFFDKGNLRGVTIQSLRPMPRAEVIPMRGHK
jgi:hypothetical protein